MRGRADSVAEVSVRGVENFSIKKTLQPGYRDERGMNSASASQVNRAHVEMP